MWGAVRDENLSRRPVGIDEAVAIRSAQGGNVERGRVGGDCALFSKRKLDLEGSRSGRFGERIVLEQLGPHARGIKVDRDFDVPAE